MKPPIKLAMMQALGAQLPPAHLTDEGISALAHRLWIALATDGCVVLSWRDTSHVAFNDWLLSHLSPPPSISIAGVICVSMVSHRALSIEQEDTMSNQTKVLLAADSTIHFVLYALNPMIPRIIVTCPEAGAQFTIEPQFGFQIVTDEDWPDIISIIATSQFLSAAVDEDADDVERRDYAVATFGAPIPLDPSTYAAYDQVSQTEVTLRSDSLLLTFTDAVIQVPEKSPDFTQVMTVDDNGRTVKAL
jgi:hypothetical protein